MGAKWEVNFNCQHEKLLVLDDDDTDVMSVHDKDGNKTLAVNVCAKCMLLYAEIVEEEKP